jgi:MFS family permease
VQFAPVLAFSLPGGALADVGDRRRIALAAITVPFCVGLGLCALARTGGATLPLLYVAAFAIAAASAFESPARAALLPDLVPRDVFARVVPFATTAMALGFVTGPAVAGLVIGEAGIAAAYATYAGLMAASAAALLPVRALRAPEPSGRGVSLGAIREGLSFVRARPVVLGCMLLDMLAVIFGGATALLPVYAKDILAVGPRGYGVLFASFEVGSLAMGLLLLTRPPVRHAGRVLLAAVAVYGVATVVFGLSRSFPLSFAAYAAAGMADQVSVVMRHTTVQLATPDVLRGRVSAVNSIFIGASNQLGAVESGFVAAATSAPFAVVTGGLACLVVVAVVARRIPELARYRVDRAAQA